MALEAFIEFVRARTSAEEIELFTSGQGILLPDAVRAEIARVQSDHRRGIDGWAWCRCAISCRRAICTPPEAESLLARTGLA